MDSLGYIVANVPGAVAGAALGNRLGAVRDAKGKSVAEVFVTLDPGAKAEVSLSSSIKQGLELTLVHSCLLDPQSSGDEGIGKPLIMIRNVAKRFDSTLYNSLYRYPAL